MNVITRSIIGLSILACSGRAAAIMITGTVDGVPSEFYQEDIWQIISDITPDTRAERKLLSKTDKKFVKQVSKLQKKIIKLENKAATRGLREKQENRLRMHEDRLVELLNSRDLLDNLILSGLNDTEELVNDDLTNNNTFDSEFTVTQTDMTVPEPSVITLLALGLVWVGVAHDRRKGL